MSNILIAEPTLSDAALDPYFISFNAGGVLANESAAAPWSNLLDPQPKAVGESNDLTTLELRFDLSHSFLPSISYDFLWIGFTNLTTAATITWDGDNDSAFGSPDWTSGTDIAFASAGQSLYDRRHGFFKISSLQSARYVRVRIKDPTNPDGFMRMGRFYCAKSFVPTVNIQFGLNFGFDDGSQITTTTHDEEHVHKIEPRPRLQFKLQAFGSGAQAEMYNSVHEMMRRVGGAGDVVVLVDPGDASFAGPMTYYGRLQAQPMINLSAFQYYEAPFELRGLI